MKNLLLILLLSIALLVCSVGIYSLSERVEALEQDFNKMSIDMKVFRSQVNMILHPELVRPYNRQTWEKSIKAKGVKGRQ